MAVKAKQEQPEKVLEECVIGRAYFVETLTKYYTGRLQKVTPTALIFDEWAWIPDTGRFGDFLRTGTPNECEPGGAGELVLPRHECRLTGWPHSLPDRVK